jgi:long-chain acyl-CoA synthetase
MLAHLYELVQRRAEGDPTTVALGGQQGLAWKTVSGRLLLQMVDRLAEDLAERGVRAGDRVVLWVPNQWRTPIYFFALWKLGAVIVPFDRETNPEAGARILVAVEPRCILVGYGERPAWAAGREVVEWWLPAEGAASTSSAEWSRPAETLAAIVFTSGTTGSPKGCMISHANLWAEVEALAERIPLDASCRLASILPLSHLFELTGGLLFPLFSGAAIHYIPSRRPPDILRVLKEQRVTHMVAVPQLLSLMGQRLEEQLQARLPGGICRALNAAAERLSLSARRRLFWLVHRQLGGQLRVMFSGGAALPAETQRLWERLGVRIVQGYGTSECSPVVTLAAPDGSTPLGSVGRPLAKVEVRLSGEGEVLVRGPNVMLGYWQDPDRTAEVLSDGWYATGDLATVDERGNLRLAGRAKDLIVLPSGLNVWPQDVEDVLRSEAAVGDAVVLAVPTVGGGARLHAYLVRAAGAAREADLAGLIARANGRLAQHQRVATVSWWDGADFPRTSTLKVRRNLLPLPEQAAALTIDSVLASDDPVGQAVASVAHLSAVRPEQTLGELGLDSLGLIELALALEEKVDKPVAEEDLHLDLTVAQVQALLLGISASSGARPARLGAPEPVGVEQPRWPYGWGRIFRFLALPLDLLYRYGATRTIVLGPEHLERLPARVIFAGTHHSFPDMPLVRQALLKSPARALAGRLVIAVAATNLYRGKPRLYAGMGPSSWYGVLALGLYPLRQSGDDASLRGLARLAGQGSPVLIFPQGTHSRPEEERAGDPAARFRAGVGHLAAALDAAVVPFGLAGTEAMIPAFADQFKGRLIAGVPVAIRRGPVAIAFGPPLTLQPDELPQEFAGRLQQVSFALTRQAEQALER